jgi:hypothetical protein
MFQQFWQRFEHEDWQQDSGRLVVQLASAETSQQWVEPVADEPSIELHFALQLNGEPSITAVSFPDSKPIHEAIRFLAQELGEYKMRVAGPIHWHDRGNHWTACWPMVDDDGQEWHDLDVGLRVKVIGEGANFFLAAAHFDGTHGWTLDAAREWVDEYASPERSASLAGIASAADLVTSHQLVGALG